MMNDLTSLKDRIHRARMPLPPSGRRFMGLVYFIVPVVAGCCFMQWVGVQADANLADRLAKNPELVDSLQRRPEVVEGRRTVEALFSSLQKGKQ